LLPKAKAGFLLKICIGKQRLSMPAIEIKIPVPCYDQDPGPRMFIWSKYSMELIGKSPIGLKLKV
jgi:hypothetical protein